VGQLRERIIGGSGQEGDLRWVSSGRGTPLVHEQ
jgi:hypothetical protein